MKTTTRITIMAIMLLVSSGLWAEVRLPRLIRDGMVLQRDTDLKIWGWASPKEAVVVTFLDRTYKTKADSKGNWSVMLPAQKAGGGYRMQINNIVINDILFGDVWLCSGQSNMELPVHRTLDLYANEVAKAGNPNIRYFRMPVQYDFNNEEPDYKGGEWKAVTPENVLQYSAVAYFFAKELYEKYQIPIGLINTAVGGTPAEAWISANALKKYPVHEAEARKYAAAGFIEETRKQEQQKSAEWYNRMITTDKGLGRWYKEGVNTSDWNDFYLPGLWGEKGVDMQSGVIWFRKTFELTSDEARQAATLRLGYIIDSDSTFVNGQFVGTTGYQYPPRIYKVPEGVLKAGENTIAIRIVTNAGGGFKEDKPYKLVLGNRTIDLTGEWKYRIGAELPPAPPTTFFQYKPMGLYNGLIVPLNNYKLKGVIWYQGESNIGRAKEYAMLFQDLITDWRIQRDDPQLPFIFVQLPELNKASKMPSESGLAELREAQSRALALPYTGMAVALGLGEWNDIHPINKQGIGQRLALEAHRVAYGDTAIVSSPRLESWTIEGNSIILTLSSVGSGLYANAALDGFAIAAADNHYVWANAVVLSRNQVRVWSDQIPQPVSVRYAWADNPAGANLKNKEGLPAAPFKTEQANFIQSPVPGTITGNKTGVHNGFDYELWRDKGDVSMTLKEGGAFECQWSNINNVLFRTGKKFDSTKTHDGIGVISLTYGCHYRPVGNSYLCVYGWSVDPLIEFYIVEAWGNWRPPGAESKGTVEIDGGTYDIYETTRIEQPSIQGDTTFQQYWSVRTDKKTEGTVSISKHFEAWEKMGMKLGKIYEVALCVEGYQSSGTADVYGHVLTIGDTTVGTKLKNEGE